ncbi:hypothetical protein [Sulfitobacter sp. EhC04]|uniref:hypothetical protein n=1 Tax=Sulfitobacter sp. EhC04 TaxID=1849168 RepID=UPI0010FE3A7C|nr:hypothetical protein [Sulfitobacter sp. EhC04]
MEVQEPHFEYWKIFVFCMVFLFFVVGSKANDIVMKPEPLTLGQNAVFLGSSFLFLAFPMCHVVYEAFLTSRDLFVWVGSIVPPLTAGFTARTQMTKFTGD